MNGSNERTLQIGHGRFDSLSGEIFLDGNRLRLRPRTAALLAHLVRNKDRIVTKDELMSVVWPDVVVTEDSLVQCVKEIRQALGRAGRDWIRTIPRQGYAFIAGEEVEPVPASGSPTPSARWWRPALVIAMLTVLLIAAESLWLSQSAHKVPSPLSIVVVPIANRTGDPARADAADDLTEALADALSRIPGMTVIAPRTAFTFKGKPLDLRQIGNDLDVRYVVEGTLHLHDARPSLTIRLADTSNEVQLWSRDFAASGGDIDTLRNEVADRIAATLGLQLMQAEARGSRETRAPDPTAVDLLAQARAALRWSALGSEDVSRAQTLLKEAVRRDSDLADAWALLAKTYLNEVRFSATHAQQIQQAADALARAQALELDSPTVRDAQAWVLYNQGRMQAALAAFDRAIESNRNDPELLAYRGATLVMLGRAAEAIAPIQLAIRISPRDPKLPNWQLFEGVAYLQLKQDDQAVVWLKRSVEGNPKTGFGHLFLASALGNAGHLAEARAEMSSFLQGRPGFTLSRFRALEPSDAPTFRAQREHVYEGLRHAGMPE